MRTHLLFSVALLGAVACQTQSSEPAPLPRASAQAAAAAPRGDHFGTAITATEKATLVDIAKAPASFKGKTLVTTGKVTRVCQEQGCWMAIKDTTTNATVRMHGHTFFVPTTSAGKDARVQGTVVLTKDGHECDEAEAVGAELEIDATGVELSSS